jgi:hypothetical protein
MANKKADPRVVIAAVAVQSVIAAVTLRDLARRPADRIRGPKWMWRIFGTANTAGSAAYWLVGRKG